MRIGIGYDIHRLIQGRKLFLGGIEIPYMKGLEGHSDSDVLLHAVCDALLGAAGCGDIGMHFPNTNSKFKDISSIELLKRVVKIISKKGFRASNIDTVLIAEEPKILPFKERMISAIAKAIGIKKEYVSVKATTSEGLGAIGRGEGIAAYAVASVLSHARARKK